VDPEEKVRAAVCKLYGGLPYEVALHHVDVASLHCVAERIQDKKVYHTFRSTLSRSVTQARHIQASVTTEALEALGQLYSAAHTEM
jgi:sister-chromatid-cohesion protein PDS5